MSSSLGSCPPPPQVLPSFSVLPLCFGHPALLLSYNYFCLPSSLDCQWMNMLQENSMGEKGREPCAIGNWIEGIITWSPEYRWGTLPQCRLEQEPEQRSWGMHFQGTELPGVERPGAPGPLVPEQPRKHTLWATAWRPASLGPESIWLSLDSAQTGEGEAEPPHRSWASSQSSIPGMSQG